MIDLKPTPFAEDVLKGLSSSQKYLSSQYFYDKAGDELFRQIMEMPEYYPTDCEYEILTESKELISKIIGASSVDLIEFGAGDAYKTRILLKHLLASGTLSTYIPIDISGDVLRQLQQDLSQELPTLSVRPVKNEYFSALIELQKEASRRRLVVFLGSNIGNFTEAGAFDFIEQMDVHLNPGDFLLLGVDLKKDPAIVLKAYNDPKGITAAFNLNLLVRMNRELDASFKVDKFYHYPTYDPSTGSAKSFLVSKADQDIYIGALDKTFHFWNGEVMATEISQKYELKHLKDWGARLNYQVRGVFMDKRSYFCDILFKK